MIDEALFNEWLQHPVTEEVRRLFGQLRQEQKDSWEAGRFTSERIETTALLQANAIGKCEAYAAMHEMDYNWYKSEVESGSDEQIGPAPVRSGGLD